MKSEIYEESSALLSITIQTARETISKISAAFRSPWNKKPSTGVRAVFGLWAIKPVQHLLAITVLAEEGDLGLLAEVHYRQMFEILLQVRYLAMAQGKERELLAQKVSAWGCLDWLEKMERSKDYDFAKSGYTEVSKQLKGYDPSLINQIRKERSQRKMYWFGTSISRLAKQVSRGKEDLEALYHIISGQMHGSWDVTLSVSNPEPGLLDFREYPDKDTLYRWTADIVDRANNLLIQIWNEIADAVGAPSLASQP